MSVPLQRQIKQTKIMRQILTILSAILLTCCSSNGEAKAQTSNNMTQADIKTWVNAGGSNVSVTLSVSEPTGISQVRTDESKPRAYTLTGTLAKAGQKGIIIQNGKKVIR